MDEFERIRTYFAPLSGAGAYGLSDDTACLPDGNTPYVVSTDTIVSGVHFIGDEPPYQLAQKLLAVTLSDLASVGATPVCYTLNITLPQGTSTDWFVSFCQGLQYMQNLYDIYLIGGDTTHFPHKHVVLSATVYGTDAYPLHRHRAKPGDRVCITAATGLGYVGLQIALGKIPGNPDTDKRLLQYYQTPTPHIDIGRKIAPFVNACCDVSDGLVADLGHIATASHVDITLHMPDIPIAEILHPYAPYTGINHAVLAGGDDYVLACTICPENIPKVQAIYPDIQVIGTVSTAADMPSVTVLNADKQDITPDTKGFIHTR